MHPRNPSSPSTLHQPRCACASAGSNPTPPPSGPGAARLTEAVPGPAPSSASHVSKYPMLSSSRPKACAGSWSSHPGPYEMPRSNACNAGEVGVLSPSTYVSNGGLTAWAQALGILYFPASRLFGVDLLQERTDCLPPILRWEAPYWGCCSINIQAGG